MQIELTGAGRIKYSDSCHRWVTEASGYQITYVAGEQLSVLKESGVITLRYMGYSASGFDSMAEARGAAQEFVCGVFDLLKQRVVTYPPVNSPPPSDVQP